MWWILLYSDQMKSSQLAQRGTQLSKHSIRHWGSSPQRMQYQMPSACNHLSVCMHTRRRVIASLLFHSEASTAAQAVFMASGAQFISEGLASQLCAICCCFLHLNRVGSNVAGPICLPETAAMLPWGVLWCYLDTFYSSQNPIKVSDKACRSITALLLPVHLKH